MSLGGKITQTIFSFRSYTFSFFDCRIYFPRKRKGEGVIPSTNATNPLAHAQRLLIHHKNQKHSPEQTERARRKKSVYEKVWVVRVRDTEGGFGGGGKQRQNKYLLNSLKVW